MRKFHDEYLQFLMEREFALTPSLRSFNGFERLYSSKGQGWKVYPSNGVIERGTKPILCKGNFPPLTKDDAEALIELATRHLERVKGAGNGL